jgi:hypothetical protein
MHPDVTKAVASEYPVLKRYLGELRFSNCLRDSLKQGLDQPETWKQAVELFPDRLSDLSNIAPEIAELATLERAMRKAFEAADSTTSEDTALHPSVSLLTFHYNSASLWSALICGEHPPRTFQLDKPQYVLAWRHKGQSRMRLLGEEEYFCMKALPPCKKTTPTDANTAMSFYIAGWLDSDVVLAAPSGFAEK